MLSRRRTKIKAYHSELGYQKIYDRFHWFLKLTVLRIFDDDYIKKPFVVLQVIQMMVGSVMIILHLFRYVNNVDSAILSLSALLAAFEITLKIIGLVYERKRIIQLLRVVLNDCSYMNGAEEAAICDKYLRLASKLFYWSVGSYFTTCSMLIFYPVVAGKLDQYVLPVGYSVPFVDYRQQPWYLINYIGQTVHMLWVAAVFIGLDGPFYLFVCYCAAQLEILILYVSQIGKNPDNDPEEGLLIRKVFEAHTRLSEFLAECSSIYREIFLMQLLCSIGHICVSLFHIQLKLKNGSYGMLMTNISKMWLFCYCGELVVSKSAEFYNALYANQWYQLWNHRHYRNLLFMLCNAQRNYGFSIGGFGCFSYEMFTVIMKTAYTCNAFLHRVMN